MSQHKLMVVKRGNRNKCSQEKIEPRLDVCEKLLVVCFLAVKVEEHVEAAADGSDVADVLRRIVCPTVIGSNIRPRGLKN